MARDYDITLSGAGGGGGGGRWSNSLRLLLRRVI